MSAQPPPLSLYVVSHTHWDREWYHPLGRFRQRLIDLIDELLDAPPPEGTSFLLDGQTILLDDYLAVRPERGPELGAMLRSGRLEAGPWYVLGDELIPGGEALVRNLLLGAQTLRQHGAASPPVLYCPDSFGHPARLPALAAQFGFPVIILWRGYGGARWPAGDVARWNTDGGDSALMVHLPPDGYEFGANLPVDGSKAADRWSTMRSTLESRATLGIALLLNGADHHARQDGLDRAIASLRRAAAPADVRVGSMAGFVDAVARAATSSPLPAIQGELRDSYGYTWTLGGTLASRAAQKRRNARIERQLVYEAEPWAAIARRRGGRSLLPQLRAAWKTLLANHPHDTLCGCVPDEVARAADARFDAAATQAEGIVRDALAATVDHDDARARERAPMWRPVVVLRNPVPRSRGGIAEIEILAKIADVPVGPGSAPVPQKNGRTHGDLRLSDPDVPIQVLERSERFDLVESPRHYPDCDLVESRRVLAWVSPLSGYATRSFDIVPGDTIAGAHVPIVRTDGLRMWNGTIDVRCDEDGKVSLTDATGVTLRDVIGWEHQADLGDLYTPSLRGRAVTSARLRRQRLLHRGPLRAAVAQEWTMRVPRAAGERRPVDVEWTCVVSLDAGSPRVRVSIAGDNIAADHRMRVLFRTAIDAPQTIADAAFGPVRRSPLSISAEDALMERVVNTAPLHRWVCAHSATRGVAVISDGLAEYEAMADGTVAVTLVRGVAELSRADLPERPGRAGWPVSTPEAQCLGPFEASFAILPLERMDDDAVVTIARVAEDVLVPLRGDTLRASLRLPAPTDGVELEGHGLEFSALKDSSDGAWTVLRCINLLDRPVLGGWKIDMPVSEARASRLDESVGGALVIDQGFIPVTVPPHGVSTILVR